MAEKTDKARSLFLRFRPSESDPKLEAIFDTLNEKVFEDKLPKIPINWTSEEFRKENPMAMGGYVFSPDKKTVAENYILINPDIVDRQIEETVCHEMVHYKTQLIDFENGVEFFSEKSCCPGGKNGGHADMFIELGDAIHKKFGYRIDQYYTDTTKSSLQNAGEEDFEDDGGEYDYTFYKVNGVIRCQKLVPGAKHMDKFPLFHGRIEELNDVPPTLGNPFEDRNFCDESILNVYTRPLDKWCKDRYEFLETGTIYRTADDSKVEVVFVMEK